VERLADAIWSYVDVNGLDLAQRLSSKRSMGNPQRSQSAVNRSALRTIEVSIGR
jgi:hypothetical protein